MMVDGYAPFGDSLTAALPAHSENCAVSWHLDQNVGYAVRGIAQSVFCRAARWRRFNGRGG
jgi:hypothetical protein